MIFKRFSFCPAFEIVSQNPSIRASEIIRNSSLNSFSLLNLIDETGSLNLQLYLVDSPLAQRPIIRPKASLLTHHFFLPTVTGSRRNLY